MNQSLERILKNLAGNNDLQQVSLEELEKITDEHPYFSVSHILLANKLQLEGDERFEKQAQKAALHTTNPWWLHYQITNEMELLAAKKNAQQNEPATSSTDKAPVAKVEEEKALEAIHAIVPPQDRDRVLLTDGDDNVSPEALLTQPTTLPEAIMEEEIKQETSLPVAEEDEEVDPRFEREDAEETNEDEVMHAVIEEEDEPDKTTEDEKQSEETLPPKELTAETEETEPVTELVPITTEFTQEELEVADKLAHETLAEVDPQDGNALFVLPAAEEPVTEVPITTIFTQQELDESSRLAHAALAETYAEPAGESLFVLPAAREEALVEEAIEGTDREVNEEQPVDNIIETPIEATEATNEVKPPVEPALEPVPTPEPESHRETLQNEEETFIEEDQEFEMEDSSPESYSNNQMLQNIKSILDTPLTTDKTAAQSLIPIDPYYTVDYFASQGIKLVLENEPTDKLGKKLKKFTQWLKHMKKLGPEDAIENEIEEDSEATVIRIADFSNTQREIITEAMALVLEKQGKKEKAIQIYVKLSFLYPEKSAYFADKIKILKGIK